jgi:import inner membrane translocase subunit TIM50
MFAVLTRPVQRNALAYSVRYMAKTPSPSSLKKEPENPPTPPTPPPEAEVAQEPTLDTPLPSNVPSLDFSPPEPSEGRQRTGAKSSKGSLSSGERKRRVMGRVSLAMLALGFGVGTVYMGREWEEDELKIKKIVRQIPIFDVRMLTNGVKALAEAPATRWGRTKDRFTDLFDVSTGACILSS